MTTNQFPTPAGRRAAERCERVADENVGAFGIEANRRASSVFGSAQAWLKADGKVQTFETLEDAQQEAKRLNGEAVSPNVFYVAKPFESDADYQRRSNHGMY